MEERPTAATPGPSSTRNKGLPQGTVGHHRRHRLAQRTPSNVYAIVEAEDGGVFRSRDGGETWERTNEDRELRQRAWYYSRDLRRPATTRRVYVLNVQLPPLEGRRQDASAPSARRTATTTTCGSTPDDPLRMIEANDGGANVSVDGGESWSTHDNQPTAQIYRVIDRRRLPLPHLRRAAGQLDACASARARGGSASASATGSRPRAARAATSSADPDDPDVVFGGSYGGYLVRLDHRTGEGRDVNVWPDNPMGWGAAELKYRFQWNFPIFFSPHDPDLLYAAGNVLFRTRTRAELGRRSRPT